MDVINTLFTGPVLPASIAIGLLVIWSLLAVVGAIGTDPFGFGVDADVTGIGSTMQPEVSGRAEVLGGSGNSPTQLAENLGGIGVATVRWLNLHDVPIMLWFCVFTFIWWVVSLTGWLALDRNWLPQTWWMYVLLVIRNIGIALPITKYCTKLSGGWFDNSAFRSDSLVGQECIIWSASATPKHGQAKMKTDGAPLLLNINTDGPDLAKGDRVWITHYDAVRRVYLVTPSVASSEESQ